MYEIFEKLCDLKGITPYKFCKDTGVNSSTISTWKKNNSQCRPELAEKVCTYFGVSHDYLMTGKEPEYNTEIANTDIALTNMSERLKAYALKMSELSKENQEFIIKMIDKLKENKVK